MSDDKQDELTKKYCKHFPKHTEAKYCIHVSTEEQERAANEIATIIINDLQSQNDQLRKEIIDNKLKIEIGITSGRTS